MGFGQRLSAAMAEHGPLCVGIDPHDALLDAWGLSRDVAGLREFARRCVEAFGGEVAMVKPQSAFFERFGSAGVAVLEETLDGLRAAGTLTLLDVKRGDVGSTMDAYAATHLGESAPIRADAITVSPYLGTGSLLPAVQRARAAGAGLFVLGLTSNPEGAQVQHARGEDGRTIAQQVIETVQDWNGQVPADQVVADFGLVVGATVGKDIADLGLAQALADCRGPLLAPGVGAQGATYDDVARGFGVAAGQVLPSSSRAVLAAGPDVAALRATVVRERDNARKALTAG
ncbi:orotidine-5'-phosphate decarboxylase [Calidifontibacter terrae]